MRYNGKKLLLDNFRLILKDFSIDIQDVVRSAILDDVDIIPWVVNCKNDPYRLEQIRLALKEGFPDIYFKLPKSEQIYKVRYLKRMGVDISSIEILINRGYITDSSIIDTMLLWVEKGYNLSKIDITLIPKEMYSIFELGFQKGYDMSLFNDGRKYSNDYIWNCFVILANKKSIKPFVSSELYSVDCLKSIATFSKVSDGIWNRYISCINPKMPLGKIIILMDCVKTGLPTEVLKNSEWSVEAIRVLLKAYEKGLNYTKLISSGSNVKELEIRLKELQVESSKKIGGRLRKTD